MLWTFDRFYYFLTDWFFYVFQVNKTGVVNYELSQLLLSYVDLSVNSNLKSHMAGLLESHASYSVEYRISNQRMVRNPKAELCEKLNDTKKGEIL